MSGHRKLGRPTDQRIAMLRSLTTQLIYHGKIKTTVTRAKEVRRIAEKLITAAIRERDNFEEVTVTARVPRLNKEGRRIREEINGKRVCIYDEVEKKIKKDNPSRLAARRKILSVLYPVTEVPADGKRKKALSKSVDLPKMMFEELGPKYADRNGGYTRIIKLGPRKGDGAEIVSLELV